MKNFLAKLISRSESSRASLVLLNAGLWIGIPFNRPHRFWVLELTKERARVEIPFRTLNRNHVRGLHACALATGAEYATGLLLVKNFSFAQYRLLMKRIEVQYLRQGRAKAYAVASADAETLRNSVTPVLQQYGEAELQLEVKVIDSDGEALCEARIDWHLKDWLAEKR